VIAALCIGSPEAKAEVRNSGGLEALVRGLKLGSGAAVGEASCVLRCLVTPVHAFWDETMASIYSRQASHGKHLHDCALSFYRAEGSPLLQQRALEGLLSEDIEKAARSQYVWALLHLVSECDANRFELAELYAKGIAPLKQRLNELAEGSAHGSPKSFRELVKGFLGRRDGAAQRPGA